MFTRSRFIVVLDANVLYPGFIRNILLRLASQDLYSPVWSSEIQDEWVQHLCNDKPDIAGEKIEHLLGQMEKAFPDAIQKGHEALIEGIELPDEDDRHVLAVAINSNAQVIVTQNLKDFPQEATEQYGIEAQHPDVFINHQFGLCPNRSILAIKELKESFKNPPRSYAEIIEICEKQGLALTAEKIRNNLELIT